MSSKHTVPAMRELAVNVRIKADQIIREAEAEAAELRAAADEIEADATAKEQQQAVVTQQAPGAPCAACGCRLIRDPLGWLHVDHEAAEACPGSGQPVPAPPTAPFDAVPADTLVVSHQSTVATATDGQLGTREVAEQ